MSLRAAIRTTLCVTAIALSCGVTPAGAVVTALRGHGYGVTPILGVNGGEAAARALARRSPLARSGVRPFDGPPEGGGALLYRGGPVMHSVTAHVIYWDPGKEFTSTTKGIVSAFIANVAHDSGLASNVYGVGGQYTDESGHNAAYQWTSAAALLDEAAYPSSGCTVPKEIDSGPPYTECLTDEQLQSQLSSYVATNALPRGPTQLYLVLLPHAVVTCLPPEGGFHPCSNNAYCAYHSYINAGSPEEIIYADIPFSLLDTTWAKGCQDDGIEKRQLPNGDKAGTNASTRFADVALKYLSHESIEAATDPLVGAQTAWVDENGQEIGDKCNGVSADAERNGIGYDANSFKPTLGGSASEESLYDQSINGAHYYLQSEWDNARLACLMRPAPISGAGFTVSEALVGVPVSFTGAAVDAYGGLEYSWSFGDGGKGSGAKPSHTYATPGKYTVEMTPRDSLTGATSAPVSQVVEVVEPPDPAPVFSATPKTAIVRQAVSFNGAGSFDLHDKISSYKWTFGDGGEASGASVEHAYAKPGSYEATLTVRDEEGKSNSVTHAVTVEADEPPSAAFTVSPAAAMVGTAFTFDGSSSSDPDGSIVSYTWEWSDGSAPGSGVGASHTFAVGGVYTVKLTVRDSEGESASTTREVTVLAAPPLETPVGKSASTPNSVFSLRGKPTVNAATGAITLSLTVVDPGTLRWLATFANGRYGVFAARARCGSGFVRLAGRCRPSRIVFARASHAGGPDTITVTLTPNGSALRALRTAARRRRGVPVTIVLTFQSARGGQPFTHTLTWVDRIKRRRPTTRLMVDGAGANRADPRGGRGARAARA